MHIYICLTGIAIKNIKLGLQPLNYMWDLTQFIVSYITTDTKSELLVNLFMVEFVISFGMLAVSVVDGDRRFWGAFEAMCKSLKITF